MGGLGRWVGRDDPCEIGRGGIDRRPVRLDRSDVFKRIEKWAVAGFACSCRRDRGCGGAGELDVVGAEAPGSRVVDSRLSGELRRPIEAEERQ